MEINAGTDIKNAKSLLYCKIREIFKEYLVTIMG